jgi:hypothetical protein
MTVQIDIDEEVLAEIDANAKLLKQDRETVLKDGLLNLAAKLRREAEVAAEYHRAYSKYPQTADEVGELAEISDWGDEWDGK